MKWGMIDGVNTPKTVADYYSIAYTQFIMPLLKAIQELARLNDDKNAKIDLLKKQVIELRSLVLAENGGVLSRVKNIGSQLIGSNSSIKMFQTFLLTIP